MPKSPPKTEELYAEITRINDELAQIGADAEFLTHPHRNSSGLPRNFMDRSEFNARLDMLEDHFAKYIAAEAHHKNVIDQASAAIAALSPLLIQEEHQERGMKKRLEAQKEEAARKLLEASRAAFQQKLAIHNHWANFKPVDAAEFRRECSTLIDKKIAAYKAADGGY
jgi:flagellar biosynthesis GTPase FlhF